MREPMFPIENQPHIKDYILTNIQSEDLNGDIREGLNKTFSIEGREGFSEWVNDEDEFLKNFATHDISDVGYTGLLSDLDDSTERYYSIRPVIVLDQYDGYEITLNKTGRCPFKKYAVRFKIRQEDLHSNEFDLLNDAVPMVIFNSAWLERDCGGICSVYSNEQRDSGYVEIYLNGKLISDPESTAYEFESIEEAMQGDLSIPPRTVLKYNV